jgi:hypothetical protein
MAAALIYSAEEVGVAKKRKSAGRIDGRTASGAPCSGQNPVSTGGGRKRKSKSKKR